METVYDWITVAIFAGLVTRFLSTSVEEDGEREDSIWHYLAPSVGCAIANWLGNEGYPIAAVLLIGVCLAYIYYFIWPARRLPPTH